MMRTAAALVLLILQTQAAMAAPVTGPIRILESGDDDGRDAAICHGFSMTEAEVRAFLTRAAVLKPPEEHDHFDYFPCFVRGTLLTEAGVLDWRIQAGGLATMTLPDGSTVRLGDPSQRVEPGP